MFNATVPAVLLSYLDDLCQTASLGANALNAAASSGDDVAPRHSMISSVCTDLNTAELYWSSRRIFAAA